MWTVIHITYQEDDAQKVKEKLSSEGFLVKIKQVGKNEDVIFELSVPEAEAEEAHSVINDNY
ncbi:hypothetical protein [Maledivibacter halophilus]|uniref:Signal transducing protein n=1 Tax=Maledivibacter halophilus TaxID=36842 RepID=A0A1T5MX71_9FIRM|nr:hypothetical protein [Maledivibacter halophilus]SKC92806.1 hypothetical protein SAMN02194393_05537 [Maledivibacter halophilus]